MDRVSSSHPFLPLLLGAACVLGCSKTYIPNTDVEDTKENRDVIIFCERYRKAIERQDIVTLFELASPDYYEDGGNVDAHDDIDYAGLRDYLATKFGEANSIRYEIRYRRVVREEDRVFIDYTFSGSYRYLTSEGEKWKNAVAENRLELIPEGESFQILNGM